MKVERWGIDGHTQLSLERAGSGWEVNGVLRPDLEEAEEPDLSVTPFCNTLPIRRMIHQQTSNLMLETCSIDARSMRVTRSLQKYEWVTKNRLRYIDLGLYIGYEADLTADKEGFVITYGKLFRRVAAM